MNCAAHTPLDDCPPLLRLSARDLAEAFAARRLSPVEVVAAALDRAETVQSRFNAFTRIERAGALAGARAAEARWAAGAPLSPIDGMPATIKDIVWVEGWPIRYGSLATAGLPPATRYAPSVRRLVDHGAVLIGLTTTPEFGWKALTDGPTSGTTLNPWDETLTPGGSSGGAAVAAATGAGLFHLGTDGGGSIRIPAAFTGTVGLKPTYGRVAAYPASPFGTVAHVGPMARRVAEIAAMFIAMAGRDGEDWLQGPGVLPPIDLSPRRIEGARIGVWRQPPCGSLDPSIAAAFEARVAALAAAGAVIEPVELPEADLLSIFRVLWCSGAAARLAPLTPAQRAAVDPGLLAIAAEGEGYSARDYIAAASRRAEFGRGMDALVERFDVVLSPATSVLPFAAGVEVPPGSGLTRWFEWAGFSFPINLTQQPALSLPMARTAGGLPINLQIVGPRGADGRVLAFGAAIESAFPEPFL